MSDMMGSRHLAKMPSKQGSLGRQCSEMGRIRDKKAKNFILGRMVSPACVSSGVFQCACGIVMRAALRDGGFTKIRIESLASLKECRGGGDL